MAKKPPKRPTSGTADDDKVGYGRPPKEHQFKDGETGNRNGRPKGKPSPKDIVRKELFEPTTITVNGRKQTVPYIQAQIKIMKRAAIAGSVRSQLALLALPIQIEEDEGEIEGFDEKFIEEMRKALNRTEDKKKKSGG